MELLEAIIWYEERQEGLGESLRLSIDSRLKLIQEYPKRYRKIRGEYRQVSLNRFPYAIIYFLKDDSEIVIYSIFHHSRNPRDKFR